MYIYLIIYIYLYVYYRFQMGIVREEDILRNNVSKSMNSIEVSAKNIFDRPKQDSKGTRSRSSNYIVLHICHVLVRVRPILCCLYLCT